jgi:hypothetical protein
MVFYDGALGGHRDLIERRLRLKRFRRELDQLASIVTAALRQDT